MNKYKACCPMNIGDTVSIPFEKLPEAFQNRIDRKAKKAKVIDKTDWLVVFKIIPSGQILSYQYFECFNFKILDSENQKSTIDDKELMRTLTNIK